MKDCTCPRDWNCPTHGDKEEAKAIVQKVFTGPAHEEAVRKAAKEGAEEQNRALKD